MRDSMPTFAYERSKQGVRLVVHVPRSVQVLLLIAVMRLLGLW